MPEHKMVTLACPYIQVFKMGNNQFLRNIFEDMYPRIPHIITDASPSAV